MRASAAVEGEEQGRGGAAAVVGRRPLESLGKFNFFF